MLEGVASAVGATSTLEAELQLSIRRCCKKSALQLSCRWSRCCIQPLLVLEESRESQLQVGAGGVLQVSAGGVAGRCCNRCTAVAGIAES